jgi:hypothetical protein
MPLVAGHYVLTNAARNAPVRSTNKCYDKQSNTVLNGARNAVRPVRDRNLARSSNNGAHEPTRTRVPTAYVHQNPTKP